MLIDAYSFVIQEVLTLGGIEIEIEIKQWTKRSALFLAAPEGIDLSVVASHSWDARFFDASNVKSVEKESANQAAWSIPNEDSS